MLVTARLLVSGLPGKVGNWQVSVAEFWMVLLSQRLEIDPKIVPIRLVSLT